MIREPEAGPAQPAGAPSELDPEQIVEALYLRITTRQGPQGLYGPVDATAARPRGAFPLPQHPGFGIELNDAAITGRRPWS